MKMHRIKKGFLFLLRLFVVISLKLQLIISFKYNQYLRVFHYFILPMVNRNLLVVKINLMNN